MSKDKNLKVVEIDDSLEGAEAGDRSLPVKKGGKRKLIMIAAGAAVLAVGGGGYAFLGHKGNGTHPGKEATAEAGADDFIDVPTVTVNMRSPDGAARFIKVHVMIVPAGPGKDEELKKKLPLLLDAFQPFLRELRPEDLAGSAAVFRIKEELLVRAHDTLGEGEVKDILIQDLLQQ